MLSALFALAVPVFAMSCAEPDPFTEADFPLCAPQSMRVVGSIDNMSIDVTLPGAGGGLAQDNAGGEFQYQGNYTSDPAEADLRLTWAEFVAYNKATPAKGTLRLMEGPFASQSLCVGDGTTIRIPKDDTVIQFELAGIRSGEGCTVAHTGQLRGCMR
jgi:hypothetical protein